MSGEFEKLIVNLEHSFSGVPIAFAVARFADSRIACVFMR